MTDPKDTVPDTFPDVRVQPRTALIILTGLAGIYAAAFVMLSPPAKQDGLSLYASFGLGASLLVLSYIDMRTGLLLDIITLPLIAAGIAFGWLAGGVWLLSIGGAVLGYVLIAGLGLVWRRARGYEGIGLGDAKLLAAGGAWVGVVLMPLILLVASGVGLIAAIFVSLKPQKSEDRGAIPFGPALALGIWIAWCADGIAR